MPNSEQQSSVGRRVMSIDALRGFDMFWIIGGHRIFTSLHDIFDHPATAWINEQLLSHVKWEGFRPWDLIMPLFLFVVGVVMPFSFNKRLERGDSKKQLYFHIVKRTLILFVLGMIAQGHLLEYDLSKLHLYSNTLQAIAAGYLIAAIIILNMQIVWQMITTAALLLLFWALMMLVPVPGHGAGALTPDGNLAIFIDRLILRGFIDGTDPPYTWILSSMTFGCTVMLGVMAGHLLRSQIAGPGKVFVLCALGIGCVAFGSLWGGWFFGIGKFYFGLFPIIKHLWTSSFVLFSAGLCCLLLALFYLIIDVWHFKKWAFGFVVIGSNAIAVYMAVQLFDFRRIAGIFLGGLERFCGNWNPFINALAALAVIWLIMWWMYRKKTFIKV
ncbi:MAG: acyltransferase family protein [Planctomycetota bacterium]|jgi:predicted acyltransferase